MMHLEKPRRATDIPCVPMNYLNRDILVGRIMEVIEAAMPEGPQQDATKSLIKQKITDHFDNSFNDALICLKYGDGSPTVSDAYRNYVEAIWKERQNQAQKPVRVVTQK